MNILLHKGILVFLIFLFTNSLFSQSIFSVKNGIWSDSTTWSKNRIPTNGDSIYVNHFIDFNDDSIYLEHCFFYIGDTGVLCAPNTKFGFSFIDIYNFGTLRLSFIHYSDTNYTFNFRCIYHDSLLFKARTDNPGLSVSVNFTGYTIVSDSNFNCENCSLESYQPFLFTDSTIMSENLFYNDIPLGNKENNFSFSLEDTLKICQGERLVLKGNNLIYKEIFKNHSFWEESDNSTILVPNVSKTYYANIYTYDGRSKRIGINVKILSEEKIEIPNIVTPNNDQMNDKWLLFNEYSLIFNELLLYNRWGKIVFDLKNSININEFLQELPDGMYYYNTNYGNKCFNENQKGYLQILK